MLTPNVQGLPLFLWIFVNGRDVCSMETREAVWTLPISAVEGLLALLEENDISQNFAIIDGYEPALESAALKRLIALLKLYGWNVIVPTRGFLPVRCPDWEEWLEELSNTGVSWIHVDLDPKVVKAIGFVPFLALYRAAARRSLFLTSSYSLSSENDSGDDLRRLLSFEDFNRYSHFLYIFGDKEETRLPGFSADSSKGIIVGNHGTVVFEGKGSSECQRCNLLEHGWKNILKENLAQLKKVEHAAI